MNPGRARFGTAPQPIAGAVHRITATCLTIVAAALLPQGALAAGSDDPAYPGQRQPTEGFGGTEASPDKVTELDIPKDIERGVPIVAGAFADPFVLEGFGADFVYATNTSSANVPVLRISHDGDEAAYLGDALPTLPSWTRKGFQWAPAAWTRPDGTVVLYYSTPAPDSDRQCISAATSDSPSGPFTDKSSGPLVCPLPEGGAIDPSPFIGQDGDPYLLWKADGNCCGLPTTIYIQPLAADGLSTSGDPTALVSDSQDWEKGIVEAPSMVRDGDTWWLFYSGNDWNTEDYAIGVARCSSLEGPCDKPLDRAWQTSAGEAEGPGGQEFFTHSSGLRMAHHGWLPGEVDSPGSTRRLFLDGMTFDSSGLPERDDSSLGGPTDDTGWWPWMITAAAALALVAYVVFRRRRSGSPRVP
jgi:hypothetical protein